MIAGAALRGALWRAGHKLVVLGPEPWTAGQLDAAIDALAAELQRRTPPDASVGVWYQNSVYALIAHMAVQRAGRTRLCVDPAAAPPEAAAFFSAGDCHLVLVDAQHAPSVSADVLVYGPDSDPGRSPATPVEVDPDRIEYLYPRSVSDAGLLGVPISFGNWAAYIDLNIRMWVKGGYGTPVGEDDVFVTVQQLLHGTGFIGTLPFLHLGLPQIIAPAFDPDAVLDAVTRFGATCTFMVPGMLTRLAEVQHDTAQGLQRIVYGGAPITTDALISALHGTRSELTQVYGRLEGGWPLTTLTPQEHARIAAGDSTLATSCGRAVPGLEIDIAPMAGIENMGELRVRSPLVSPAFRDPNGWCRLGDLASRDAAGYLRLHGRIDGMINTGSYHVYPHEVEEAIRQTLRVINAQVNGEPDPRWGEAVTATLIWPTGVEPPADEELRTRLRQRLASYKVPTRYHHRLAADTTGR